LAFAESASAGLASAGLAIGIGASDASIGLAAGAVVAAGACGTDPVISLADPPPAGRAGGWAASFRGGDGAARAGAGGIGSMAAGPA
jgi:hypothetical protein